MRGTNADDQMALRRTSTAAALLRGIYAGIDGAAVNEYVRVLGSKPALGAALNWYRANIGDRNLQGPALGPVEVPTMFTWSDGDSICAGSCTGVAG